MRSVRRSMVVYSLLLLGSALVAVVGLLYRVTDATLVEKRAAAVALVERRYDDLKRRASRERDEELLAQARMLAAMARPQLRFDRAAERVRLLPMAGLAAAAGPMGAMPAAASVAQGVYRGPLWWATVEPLALRTPLRMDEDILAHARPAGRAEFQLVTSDFGSIWRSRSMSGGMTMPPGGDLNDRPGLDWDVDSGKMSDGRAVRRVSLKAPLTRFKVVSYPPRRGPRRGSARSGGARPKRRPEGTPPPPRRPRAYERTTPKIFVQCAWSERPLRAALAELDRRRDAEVAKIDAETAATRRRLGRRVLLIGVLSFLGVVVGMSVVIWRGLRPLKRVSEAVSRVSEKDFSLPLAGDGLPAEVAPVVDRLKQTLAELRKAFEREKQATADISHELRTPLAALLTTLEVTLRKPREAEQYRQALTDARQIGKQLSELVERILKLARLDAGVLTSEWGHVDVGELVDDCAAVARPLAREHGLDFRAEAKPGLMLRTDGGKLREVVVNLLHNAVEYNVPGGSIGLDAYAEDGRLVIEVSDTGVGISDDQREHIFERFYRADPSRESTGVHAGLGLAIVKGYTERLGGEVRLSSEPGRGSRFRVELPAAGPPGA